MIIMTDGQKLECPEPHPEGAVTAHLQYVSLMLCGRGGIQQSREGPKGMSGGPILGTGWEVWEKRNRTNMDATW